MNKKHNRKHILFLVPGFAGLAIFFLFPLAVSTVMSFQNTGILNYQQVLQSKAFHLALKNTARLIGWGIPATMILGALVALVFGEMFRKSLPGTRFLFLMYLLPLVLPSAVITLFVEIFLPYSQAPQVFYLMTGIYIWKNVPYVLLAVFLGLRNLPGGICDAARLDGANGWQMLRRIVFPFLKPYLLVGVMLAFLGVFRIFRESYLLFGNYPDQSVYFLQNYMNNLFYSSSYGPLAAASDLFLVGISILLLLALFFLGKENQR